MNCRNCGAPASNPYHCPYCNTTMAGRGDEASEWEIRFDQECIPLGWSNRRTGAFRPVMFMWRRSPWAVAD